MKIYILHITENTHNNTDTSYTKLIANRSTFSAIRLRLTACVVGVSPIILLYSKMRVRSIGS